MSSSPNSAAAVAQGAASMKAVLLMIAAMLCFAGMNGFVRLLAGTLPVVETAFFRNFFALVFTLPILLRMGSTVLRTEVLRLHLLRAGLGLCAMTIWFTAVSILPMAQAVALNFTVPLFATIAAALVLREDVRARRWAATIIGFLGVLVIVRPGSGEVSWTMTLPIVAACFMATTAILVKMLADRDGPVTPVVLMNLLLTPLSFVPALFVWVWPSWYQLGLLCCMGLIATLGQLALTRAFSLADASAILPFEYIRLPFVAVIGYLLFAEVPDVWTWIGGGIIAAAAIYIAHREAKVARERGSRQVASRSATGR